MFKLVIVGRPNVGKSTFFNFLSGKQMALTDATPNLTRDRKEVKIDFYDMSFLLIDTGGYHHEEEPISNKIWQQTMLAVKEADVLVFMVNGKSHLGAVDYYLADLLRKTGTHIILCVNKIDSKETKENSNHFYELGFSDICFTSATHNIGMQDLYELIRPYYDDYMNHNVVTYDDTRPELSLAFIGRPNAGKSTIVNNLLNEERVITSDIAGTTRDSVYLNFYYDSKKIKLVDTAGLRKKSNVDYSIERRANTESIRVIKYATIVVIVISAEEGLTKQDMTLIRRVVEEGRGLILVANKMDLIKNKKEFLQEIIHTIDNKFFQIKKTYVLGISAKEDKDITQIIDTALELYEKWKFRASTSALNKWLQNAITHNPPPMVKSSRLKLKFATQVKTRPPTIHLWTNYKEEFPSSYLRYLQKEFYKKFNLWGCTLRIELRKSDNPYDIKS